MNHSVPDVKPGRLPQPRKSWVCEEKLDEQVIRDREKVDGAWQLAAEKSAHLMFSTISGKEAKVRMRMSMEANDIPLVNELGRLKHQSLYVFLSSLEKTMYTLAEQEKKEMCKGRLLNIFGKSF